MNTLPRRPDLLTSLARHKAAGRTVLKPRGFDMVSETVDPASATRGVFYHRLGRGGQVSHVRPDTDAAA
jgi:hypothetical protein